MVANNDTFNFLSRIWIPGEVREIRAFNPEGRILFGYFDDPKIATEKIIPLLKTCELYVTLNPCLPGCLARRKNKTLKYATKKDKTTSDRDVLRIDYLFFDIDPDRPSGISSTGLELIDARETLKKLIAYYGLPILTQMSGNGYHAVYKILSLENNRENSGMLKNILAITSKMFSGKSKIDLKVFTPGRIIKIAGSWARKGENDPERPWRLAELIETNNSTSTVIDVQAVVLASKIIEPSICQKQTTFPQNNKFSSIEYVKNILDENSISYQEKPWQDATMLALDICIFDSSHQKEASILVHPDETISYQCFHDSCSGRTWKDCKDYLEMPEKISTCKYCSKEIIWTEKSGKWLPENADGTKHKCKKKSSTTKSKKSDKPEITLEAGEIHATIDTIDGLLSKNLGIYQRYGRVIYLVKNEKKISGTLKKDNSIEIIEFTANSLIESFTRLFTFGNYNKEGEFKKRNCPKYIAETYLARGKWALPYLAGIIEAPTMLPGGNILKKNGHNPESGLFVNNYNNISISENSGVKEAKDAVSIFAHLLRFFPFSSPASFSVAVAAIITCLIRRSVRSAPLFCFSAPTMGSGKTLLADIAAMISTGALAAKETQAKDQNEQDKKLLAILVNGAKNICIDNIERPLEGDSLCTILTEPLWQGRILGKTQQVTVDTCVTWMATGNNLRLKGDISTRALFCSLDAKTENPHEREFDYSIRDKVIKNRGKYISAALTIIKAYHDAGSPKQHSIKQFGRFEEWSKMVRSSLVWAGCEDPNKTITNIVDNDPVRETLVNIASSWHECFGNTATSLKEAKEYIDINESGINSEKASILKSSLAAVCKGEIINFSRIGYYLRKVKNRIESGYQILSGKKTKKGQSWYVEKIKPDNSCKIKTAKALLLEGNTDQDVINILEIEEKDVESFLVNIYENE